MSKHTSSDTGMGGVSPHDPKTVTEFPPINKYKRCVKCKCKLEFVRKKAWQEIGLPDGVGTLAEIYECKNGHTNARAKRVFVW